jgi:hypothetical protein
MWCARIGRLDTIARYYPVFKLLRRRVRRDLDDRLEMWPCVKDNWRRWTQEAISRKQRTFGHAERLLEAHLFTDASLDGWGGVLLLEDCYGVYVTIVCGAWEPGTRENIDGLEAMAVLRALRRLHFERLHWETLRLLLQDTSAIDTALSCYIDNTSILTSFQGRHLHYKEVIRRLAMDTQVIIRSLGFTLMRVLWVASIKNLADAPSRYFKYH